MGRDPKERSAEQAALDDLLAPSRSGLQAGAGTELMAKAVKAAKELMVNTIDTKKAEAVEGAPTTAHHEAISVEMSCCRKTFVSAATVR
eukprot:m.65923 g.65923  ORF g.65923 m.65923 type:complete len:89 (-) comp18027_c0_seq1:1093-1359(-)